MRSSLSVTVKFGVGILLACMVGACAQDEINPTTIKLEPFTFSVSPGQGTANNRITEVWVYADKRFLGAFSPPTNVYYLESGQTAFEFRPGIRNNGILSDAIPYPMFANFTVDLEAIPGAVFDVAPGTSYLPSAQFPLLADFEFDNPFTDNRDTVSASMLVRSTADAFEGSYSGQMTMTEQADFIEVGHVLPMSSLPTDGTSIYLEMRYKNEVEFSIGLLGSNLLGESFTNFFYLVNPSDEWNMLYLDLTEFVEASDLDSYKILFRSLYPPGATKPELNIFLDNIKVVHL